MTRRVPCSDSFRRGLRWDGSVRGNIFFYRLKNYDMRVSGCCQDADVIPYLQAFELLIGQILHRAQSFADLF